MTLNDIDWFIFRGARERIVDLAHELDLRVYLSWHGFSAFTWDIDQSLYLTQHPEAAQWFSNGVRCGRPYACVNNAPFVEWLEGIVRDVVTHLDVDGVFWDEPRVAVHRDGFPDVWACRCEDCRALFAAQFGRSMPTTLDANVRRFRQESLQTFLRRLLAAAKDVRPGAENVLCLMPIDWSGAKRTMSAGWYGVEDWEPFVAMPEVDVFSTDPYWIVPREFADDTLWVQERSWEFFEDNSKRAVELCRRYEKRCQIWVQGHWLNAGQEPEVKRTLLAAAELGADMLAVWAYMGEPGSVQHDLGADADLVWRMVSEAYHEV